MKRWLLPLVVLFSTMASAQSGGVVFSLGLTWSAPTDLKVVQQGYPDTVVKNAGFVGKGLEWFPYYTLRLWYGDVVGLRYELELIHQKLFFTGAEQNGEIFDRFQVTDGFNYLLFNLAYAFGGPVHVVPRVGVGVMIPHPETVVRGKEWGIDGDPNWYHFGGFGAQVGVGLEANFWASPVVEAKFTIAQSRLNIAGGYAEGLFSTLHADFGGGLRLP
jgi:hypothetical protein